VSAAYRRRLLVHNGSQPACEVSDLGWAVEVTAPRVNDRRSIRHRAAGPVHLGESCQRGAGKTPKITEVLRCSTLHGLSTADFVPALASFLGSSAACRRR